MSLSDAIKIADVSRKFLLNPKNILPGPTILGTGKVSIIKVSKSLKNRGILLKGTTRKITIRKGRFLIFFRQLMIASLPLMKSVLNPFGKSVFITLELSAGVSAADATIQKKIYRLRITVLIISNEEMEGINKIVKSLEESGLLTKGISETIKNEAKEWKSGFLPIFLGTLASSILENAITRKCVIRAGESTIRADQNF